MAGPGNGSASGDDNLEDLLSEVWHADTLANSRRTREFLDAGQQLLHSGLARLPGEPAAEPSGRARAPFDELLAWVSRRRVVGRARELGGEAGKPSEASYRYRWRTQTGYLRDLVIYALRPRMARPDSTEAARQVLARGAPLDEAIDTIALAQVTTLHNDKAFRLQMVFQAILSDDAHVAGALRRIDETNLSAWRDFYHEAIKGLGITLRAGVSVDDFALAMQAAGEGTVFRSLLPGKGSSVADSSRTLALIAMAMLVAFGDRGDGKDLREAVRELPRRDTGNPGVLAG